MITASLNNYRQSPRKVRSVANLVRGKSVDQALNTLNFLSKKAADPLYGLLLSAVANAKNNFNIEKDGLIIKELRVDVGPIMKRRMPRARGNSYPINKRTSHVNLVLDVKPVKEAKVKEVKEKVKKEKK
jgi:large subunit ribosomal protein L22